MEKQTMRQSFILRFINSMDSVMFSELEEKVKSADSRFEHLGTFASLHRTYGDDQAALSEAQVDSWEDSLGFECPKFWSKTDWARLGFLTLLDQSDSELLTEEMIQNLIRRGDHSEQISLARILFYLPESKRFKDAAERWLATNSAEIFKSLALKNPYPLTYFSDLFFRQMVLKALFIDLPLEPVWGLRSRYDSELKRMSLDYKRERELADRSIPIGFDFLNSLEGEL